MKAEVHEEEIKLGLRGDKQGQYQAICKAYDHYAEPLASYAREQFPALDSHEVATAVNDVFIDLAKKAKEGNFKTDGCLKSLLFQMVRCKATDQWRARCRWYRRKISELPNGQPDGYSVTEELTDDEVASHVAQKLANAPEIATAWKTVTREWTPADQVAAIEIVRQFKVWIASALSPLQRKVAALMAVSFGGMTDEEMCAELAKTATPAPLGSVKSARREIREKFTSLIMQLERTQKP